MRLVDTSAWVEWLIGSPLGATLASELPDGPRAMVGADDRATRIVEMADSRGW
jgi:hypothetical protein